MFTLSEFSQQPFFLQPPPSGAPFDGDHPHAMTLPEAKPHFDTGSDSSDSWSSSCSTCCSCRQCIQYTKVVSHSSDDHASDEKPTEHLGLRERLATKIQDIDHVDAVLRIYEETIRPILDKREQEMFEYLCLLKNIHVLGSQFFDHYSIFQCLGAAPALLYREEYHTFVDRVKGVCASYRSQLPPSTHDTVQRIALLFPGSAGGGHAAPKQAMEQFFASRKIDILSIDTDEAEAPYTMDIVGASRAQIYRELFAKRGDLEEVDRLYAIISRNQSVEKKRVLKDIREQLVAFHPDHIFTVAAHLPIFAALSHQLSIPMTFVLTDQNYHRCLTKVLHRQAYAPQTLPLITYTSTNDHQEFFLDGDVEPGQEMSLLPFTIPLGIPVRRQFQPVTEEEKRQLRRENGIPENALVCKVAAGHFGMKNELQNILQRLQKEHALFKRPLHVIVITGANADLKKELATQTALYRPLVATRVSDHSQTAPQACPRELSLPPIPSTREGDDMQRSAVEEQESSHSVFNPLLTFDCKGFLDADQMALCDKISDFWITKAGGSTTAEAVQMRKKVLYHCVKSLSWEMPNCHYLERTGLGRQLIEDMPIAEQITTLLEQPINSQNLPREHWESYLERFLACHRSPSPVTTPQDRS